MRDLAPISSKQQHIVINHMDISLCSNTNLQADNLCLKCGLKLCVYNMVVDYSFHLNTLLYRRMICAAWRAWQLPKIFEIFQNE